MAHQKQQKIKNGWLITLFAAYRLNVDYCKSLIATFLFLLFSMCHYAFNWCDKVRFLQLYLLFYCQFWLQDKDS